nr:ATP-binding protein [Clostridium beijerinckii]
MASYANEWIIVFEGLQNALDAVENVTNPKVKVVFNIEENRVSIYDNGNGFPCDKEFFGLGKGNKSDLNNPNIRGEHGVGLKMIILCTRQFELITRNHKNNKLWYARFSDGFKFIESEDKEFFDDEYNIERLPKGYNTLIEYSFPNSEVKPIRLLNIRNFILNMFKDYEKITPYSEFLKNRDKAQLYIEHYFRTHSYSGDVNRLFDKKKPCEIEIIIQNDNSIDEVQKSKIYAMELVDYWNKREENNEYTIKFPSKYWDLTEVYSNPTRKGIFTEELLKRFNPNIKHGGSHIWIMKILDKEMLKDLLINSNLKNFNEANNYNTLIKDKIRGIYMVIGSASNSVKYSINNLLLGKADQIIAADGVITTNPIKSPKKGKNQSYLNNIHIVININDRVNYGKQGIKNPVLLSNIYKYFEQIYVSKLVQLAISVAGKIPNDNQNEYEEPEIVINELENMQGNLTIKKIPKHENTLIAIFYELIGRGVIKGIQSYHLSSYDRYDGKINIFSKINNKFKNVNRDADLMNMEFKINLSDLIKDFEDNTKNMSDLSLVVIWNNDFTINSNYHMVDIESSVYEWVGINGIKDVLCDMNGNQVPIIELNRYLQ